MDGQTSIGMSEHHQGQLPDTLLYPIPRSPVGPSPLVRLAGRSRRRSLIVDVGSIGKIKMCDDASV